MTDNHTPEGRSYNMAMIKSKDTKPEEIVRRYLFAQGFRYRKNDRRLPGKPDIVLPKYKTVVFVNGCFWHMHSCKLFVWPKSNVDYWRRKIERNVARDTENHIILEKQGWKVLDVWECQLKKDKRENTLKHLVESIREDTNGK